MVSEPNQTVTVDRISNSDNAIAQQERAGKTIHVPAGKVGETYEVRLEDKGSHFVARLADRTQDTHPRSPGIDSGPDTGGIANDLLNPGDESKHSYQVKKSPYSGKLRDTPEQLNGRKKRSWMSQQKL
jgi:hypothetical protein